MDTCQVCDVNKNYFKSGKACEICTLDGCTKCQTKDKCLTCNEDEYYLAGDVCYHYLPGYAIFLIVLSALLLIIVLVLILLLAKKPSEESKGEEKE